jgi:hypothetical protein
VKCIVHPIYEGCVEGICEVEILNARCYQLRTTSSAKIVEKTQKKMKKINLGKAKKWWNKLQKPKTC